MEEKLNMIRLDDHSREERYFAGTILPYLLAYDNFTGLRKFLSYLNDNFFANTENGIDFDNFENDIKQLQLIIEPALERDLPFYGISIPSECFQRKMNKQSKPDLMIIYNNWVILIEAKYFVNYNSYTLYQQMKEQTYILDVVKGLSKERITKSFQLAICPVFDSIKNFSMITWTDIFNIMSSIVPEDNYFLLRLKNSMERFER
jgi:hypothetical protein